MLYLDLLGAFLSIPVGIVFLGNPSLVVGFKMTVKRETTSSLTCKTPYVEKQPNTCT